MFSESYGGHWATEFAYEIQRQNAAIADGTIQGESINLVGLGFWAGLFDGGIFEKSLIEYSHKNPYRQIINDTEYHRYMDVYDNECQPALDKCTSPDDISQTKACYHAYDVCYDGIALPLATLGTFNAYDIRNPDPDQTPSPVPLDWLNRPEIQKKIGAKPMKFATCSSKIASSVLNTGDNSRPFIPRLSEVIQNGVQVSILNGDADWVFNTINGFEVVQSIEYDEQKTFRSSELEDYTIDGESKGQFKTAGKLSWLNISGCGHHLDSENARKVQHQTFQQTLNGKPLKST